MPLIQSPSKKAVSKNIEAEMHSGKPQKQSIAIAMSVQRKNKRKKMAEGGMLKSDEAHLQSSAAPASPSDQPKSSYDESEHSSDAPMPDESAPHTGESKEDMLRRHADELAMFAEGGMVMDDEDESRPGSIAEAIMRKRQGDDPGVVDLEDLSEEGPATNIKPNIDAVGKEQYDDEQLSSQPMDSIGDSREDDEENKHDRSLVGQIRSRMRKKS